MRFFDISTRLVKVNEANAINKVELYAVFRQMYNQCCFYFFLFLESEKIHEVVMASLFYFVFQ